MHSNNPGQIRITNLLTHTKAPCFKIITSVGKRVTIINKAEGKMAFNQIQYTGMESGVTNFLGSDSDDQLKPTKLPSFGDYGEIDMLPPQFFNPLSQEVPILDFGKKERSMFPAENLPNEISFIGYEADQYNQRDYLNDSPIYYQNFSTPSAMRQTPTLAQDQEYHYSADIKMKEEYFPDIQLKFENSMEIECENTSNFESTISTQITPGMSQSFITKADSIKSSKLDNSIKVEYEEESAYNYQEIKYEPSGYQAVENKIRKNLPKVCELVERVLRGKKVENSMLEDLGDYERAIIVSINQKKSKSDGVKISKRREEKQKMFFKAALKYIENNYLINVLKCRSTLRKKEADVNAFYNAYFADAALERGVDISIFYPPCQKRRFRPEGTEHLKNEIKSFNLRYIELILCSKKFREDVIEFLEEEFSQSYAKGRYKKIDKLLENAMNVLSQSYKQSIHSNNYRASDIIQLAIGNFQELVINNPKSKLPWSDCELEETKEFARQTIEKVAPSFIN